MGASYFAGLRPLPRIRVVRGQVINSAQLRAKNAAVVALPVAPDPEGEGVTPLTGTAEAGVRYGLDLAEFACRRGFLADAGACLPLDLPRLHGVGPSGQSESPVSPELDPPAGQVAPASPNPAGGTLAALPWAELAPRLVLVGVGLGRPQDLRQAGAALAAEAKAGPVLTPMGAEDPALTEALVEGFILGGYSPDQPGHTGSEPMVPDKPRPRRTAVKAAADQAPAELILLGRYDHAALARASVGAQATMLARDLTNWPAAQKTPASFAAVASVLAEQAGFDLAVLEPAQLKTQGFGGILTVGGGAASGQGLLPEPDPYRTKAALKARQPGKAIDAAWADRSPRLAVASYHPKAAVPPTHGTGALAHQVTRSPNLNHLVLVGKGVTFDSGGLRLKPTAAMKSMACDCAGAAAGLAAVWAAAALELPIQVTAVLALAENGFGAGSYRPGDIITTHSGQTVEVLDTDAEGRLILADALSYARQLNPDALVDLATLTGAARLALGEQTAALFATDQVLADRIIQAGQVAGEDYWQLPLVEDYNASLDSPLADSAHVPTKPIGGGAITAALFLRRFVGTVPWAHLDLVPAKAAKADLLTKAGATGFGTRTMIELARALA